MLKANLYRLRQCILTWDCLVPLTMLALVRQANGLCQTQRYWLLCSQGLEYGLCFKLLRSALQVPVDGRLSIGSTNRSARLRDQPKHSEFITSLVTTVQLSSYMGWLARVVAACNPLQHASGIESIWCRTVLATAPTRSSFARWPH